MSAVLLPGCFSTAYLPQRPVLTCEEVVTPCRPEKFSRVLIDTSSIPNIHLAISRVRGLSTPLDEYSVLFDPADRELALATIRKAEQDGFYSVVMTRADISEVGERVRAEEISGSIGSGARVPRNDSLYFTARRAGTVQGDYDLFTTLAGRSGLPAPRRLTPSLIIAWDGQPALSPDGSTLYFASGRRGGIGGTDLYVTRRGADGAWSDPENLGEGVNTPCDELSPFVSGDGNWLYFSSSGHPTVGGYDLFRAPIVRGQIGGVENLGMPVNTAADELFPSAPRGVNPDTLLYYSSNQPGADGFDIHVLHRLRRKPGQVTEPPRRPDSVTISGTVRNPEGDPVPNALVTVEERDPPRRKDSTETDPRGKYEIRIEEGKRYDVTAGSDTTLYERKEIYVPPSNTDRTITQDIQLPDTVTFRINFPFNNATDPYEFTLDERGVQSGERWQEVMDRAATFLKRMSSAGGRRVEIVGHTDPVGSDPFNMGLGRRRAEFVQRELVRRGVSSDLLVVRSEGESRPLASHRDESETLYHARLRRVELVRK